MNNWTRPEGLAALHLYLQLPFGQLHKGQERIKQLGQWLGRSPSSVAMKLCNLASLDSAITDTGRVGLAKASQLDRELWSEFERSPTATVLAAATQFERLETGADTDQAERAAVPAPAEHAPDLKRLSTEHEALVRVRTQQGLFRTMVLASYANRCCVTGLTEPRLLVASHIVAWSEDESQRLNPRNGLCLSPLYDRAFDQGLITITPGSLCIRVSERLREARDDAYVQRELVALEGKSIRPPERFRPGDALLERHQRRHLAGA